MTIKNGDLPAMPSGVLQDGHNCGEYPLHSGLTKREHIAAMAMVAILSKPDTTMSYAAKEGVMLADELLAELERTK